MVEVRWSINKQFGPGGAGCATVATRSQVVTGKKGFVRLRTDFGLSSEKAEVSK